MSTITYVCINEGHTKLVEYPPRMGSIGPIADSLQTVLTAVPLGESFDQVREVEDSDYTYYYSTQGRGSRFIAGCACRRMISNHNNNNSTNNITISEIKSFLKDALKLVPQEASKVSVGLHSEEKLKEIQNLLKERLEASTDRKLADVNAAIERARQTMEKNIEEALARDDHLRRMEENSSTMAESAQELQRNSERLNWKFMMQRIKTVLMVLGILAVVVLVIVVMICKPNFSECSSTTTTTTVTVPATETPSV